MQSLEVNEGSHTNFSRVSHVREFCRRYRLDDVEQTRLRDLLGDFAPLAELLKNAQRHSLTS